MGLLKPDLGKLIWAGIGLAFGPKLLQLVRR